MRKRSALADDISATVLLGASRFVRELRPMPRAVDDRAVVRVYECGLCGSDANTYRNRTVDSSPRILGHEMYGAILELPKAYAGPLAVDQLVSVFPIIECGRCPECERDARNLCRRGLHVGAQLPGGLCEAVAVPVAKLFRLSPAIRPEQRVLVEPLAVAVHAVNLAAATAGEECVVIGAGAIGILTALALRWENVRRVILVDESSDRLATASSLGFKDTIQTGQTSEQAAAAAATGSLGHSAADVVFECVGSSELVPTALQAARPGGRVVLVGSQRRELTIDGQFVQAGERHLLGSFCYSAADFQAAIDLLSAHDLFRGASTSEVMARHDPADAGTVISQLAEGRSSALKNIISYVSPHDAAWK